MEKIYYLKAEELDINRDILEAIKYYNLSIENGEKVREAYLSLLIMYHLLTYDYSFYSEYKIDNHNSSNYPKMLKLGKGTFLDDIEFFFWESYFKDIIYDDEITVEGCLSLIKQDKKGILLPYFFIFKMEQKHKQEVQLLYNQVKDIHTVRVDYIIECIGSDLKYLER